MKKSLYFLLFYFITFKIFSQNIVVDNGMGNYIDEHYNFSILLVPDIKKATKIWMKPKTPVIDFQNKFKRGDNVSPFIMYSTNSIDQNGNANIIYNFKFIEPNNSISEQDGLIIIQGKPGPSDKYAVSYQYFNIKFTEFNLLGTYHLFITIKDQNSNFEKIFDFIIYLTE